MCERTSVNFVLTTYETNRQVSDNPYAPSIDRIDNNKGYTQDNSQVVLIAYNKFKSNYNEEDIFKIAQAIVQQNVVTNDYTKT